VIHFTPASGWINDPLALTWHNGRYHLFFQYVPGRTTWAPECRWGHASSVDLVTWTEHPVALAPGDGDDGVWSGSLAVDDHGRATIFYTSVSVPEFGVGRVRTATPVDDDWIVWQKGEFVVDAPPLDLVAFRDPFVMRDDEGDGWRMLVGTALAGGTAAAATYSSPDLRTWAYEGLAARRDTTETTPVWTGALWECPQVFRLDGRDVMVTSVWQDDELHYVVYAVGELRNGRFRADHWGRLTHGPSYYAPSFFRDASGRACLIFWMRGVLDEETGRASALSVPHVLSLRGGTLVSEPHPAVGEPSPAPPVGSLDGPAFFWCTLEDDAELRLERADGSAAALVRSAGEIVLTVAGEEHRAPAAAPRVRVLVDAETLEVFTDSAVLAIGSAAPFVAVRAEVVSRIASA
jgi:beta-fructofuranosidase